MKNFDDIKIKNIQLLSHDLFRPIKNIFDSHLLLFWPITGLW